MVTETERLGPLMKEPETEMQRSLNVNVNHV